MKKKPAHRPRKIEVVEDATVTKPVKGKRAKATTVAPEAPVEPATPTPEPVATDAKPAGKKRKTPAQSEREPQQAATVKVEGKLEGKLSAIDAAVKVLSSSGPLNCKELIETMATQGLWTSPVGKTPHATLYSAMLREIATKGDESRFVKAERGKFAKRSPQKARLKTPRQMLGRFFVARLIS